MAKLGRFLGKSWAWDGSNQCSNQCEILLAVTWLYVNLNGKKVEEFCHASS